MTELKKIEEPKWDPNLIKSEHYNVCFCVGPQRTIVRAVGFVLSLTSPFFRRHFENNLTNPALQNQLVQGIPLPALDPIAFQIFVKLLNENDWRADRLNRLKLSSDALLCLLKICERFELANAVQGVRKAALGFFSNFRKFKDTSEFLRMPSHNLKNILSCDYIPMTEVEVYEAACKWAENQCKRAHYETSGQNMRAFLGDCVQEIRFPTLTYNEFLNICNTNQNILTAEEQFAIYEFIALREWEKEGIAGIKFGFKARRRNRSLVLTQLYQNVGRGEFVCDGSLKCTQFQSSRQINLQAIGFFGPVGRDSDYEITLQIDMKHERPPLDLNYPTTDLNRPRSFFSEAPYIFKLANGSAFHGNIGDTWSSGEMFTQKLRGRRDKVLYFFFPQPITIEPSSDSAWNTFYRINYWIKGSPISLFKGVSRSGEKVCGSGGSEFRLRYFDRNHAICELVFQYM